jgi:hypothetical protein
MAIDSFAQPALPWPLALANSVSQPGAAPAVPAKPIRKMTRKIIISTDFLPQKGLTEIKPIFQESTSYKPAHSSIFAEHS